LHWVWQPPNRRPRCRVGAGPSAEPKTRGGSQLGDQALVSDGRALRLNLDQCVSRLLRRPHPACHGAMARVYSMRVASLTAGTSSRQLAIPTSGRTCRLRRLARRPGQPSRRRSRSLRPSSPRSRQHAASLAVSRRRMCPDLCRRWPSRQLALTKFFGVRFTARRYSPATGPLEIGDDQICVFRLGHPRAADWPHHQGLSAGVGRLLLDPRPHRCRRRLDRLPTMAPTAVTARSAVRSM
jgi:hypothetical protein